MVFEGNRALKVCLLAVLLIECPGPQTLCQSASDEPAQTAAGIEALGLTEVQASKLKQAMEARDYITAESLLLPEIEHDSHSLQAARRLDFVGEIYFLDHDYLNAAVAWKKSEAIAPLAPSLRFSQAMAYIRMGHSDWARKVLESLAGQDNGNALYPYWLGRLDYDGHEYTRAIQSFQRAIQLAPDMARAYDNLGLCYYYQNENALAVESYKKAIELDHSSPRRSPWPYLNLAIAEQFINRSSDAEANLLEAIRLDPKLAAAHFQLGNVLEDTGRSERAIAEFRRAAQLDTSYPEPHMAMARLYHKLGQEKAAHEEVQTYLRLHGNSSSPAKSTP